MADRIRRALAITLRETRNPRELLPLGELRREFAVVLADRIAELPARGEDSHLPCDCPKMVAFLLERGLGAKLLGYKDEPEVRKVAERYFSDAAAKGFLQTAKWLVRKFPSITAGGQGPSAKTALYNAAANGKLEMVKWLFSDLGVTVEPGWLGYVRVDPLSGALLWNQARTSEWLMANAYPGVGEQFRSGAGSDLFAHLFFLNSVATVKYLVEKFAIPIRALFPREKSEAWGNLPTPWTEQDTRDVLRLMDTHGRSAMARYISHRYGLTPSTEEPPEEKTYYLSRNGGDERPPPPQIPNDDDPQKRFDYIM